MKRGLVKVDCWSFKLLAKMEESQKEICEDGERGSDFESDESGSREGVKSKNVGSNNMGGGAGARDGRRRSDASIGSSDRLWATER